MKLTENSRQLRKLSIQVISPKSFPVGLVHLPGQCSIIALHVSTTAPNKVQLATFLSTCKNKI